MRPHAYDRSSAQSAPPVETPEEARQAEKGASLLVVLVISTFLAAVLLGVAYVAWSTSTVEPGAQSVRSEGAPASATASDATPGDR